MMTVPTQTQSLVLHGRHDLRLETRPIPFLEPGEVLVEIKATGLCGSDLHYYNHGRNGNFVMQHPMCLGHESAGVVIDTYERQVERMGREQNGGNTQNGHHGDIKASTLEYIDADANVYDNVGARDALPDGKVRVGHKVALEVGLPCSSSTCHFCSTGRYNLCPDLRFRSSAKTYPHLDGTLQTYVAHPAKWCHKLRENISLVQGALIEPLAVCMHALNRSLRGTAGLQGTSALVIGAGAVGILTACLLRVSGVAEVVICDIDEARLNVCKALAGDGFEFKTILISKLNMVQEIEKQLEDAKSLAAEICSWTATDFIVERKHGFDRVFECTGVPSSVQIGIYAAVPGGSLVLVGMGNPIQTLPIGIAALKEVDVIGVFRYANCYPAAIELFASGKLQGLAEALVTHNVPLSQGEKAFRLAGNIEKDDKVAIKVMVTD